MSDPVDTLSKLFDTLKDASNRTEASTQKLIDQQMELVGHIKAMPVEQLRSALKDHADKSSKEMVDCNGVIELKTDDIMTEVKKLSTKVTKMIIVVTVAISVATSGYFLIRYAADQGKELPVDWQKKYEQTERQQQDVIDTKSETLMKEIRSEIEKLHGKDTKTEEPVNESIHK